MSPDNKSEDRNPFTLKLHLHELKKEAYHRLIYAAILFALSSLFVIAYVRNVYGYLSMLFPFCILYALTFVAASWRIWRVQKLLYGARPWSAKLIPLACNEKRRWLCLLTDCNSPAQTVFVTNLFSVQLIEFTDLPQDEQEITVYLQDPEILGKAVRPDAFADKKLRVPILVATPDARWYGFIYPNLPNTEQCKLVQKERWWLRLNFILVTGVCCFFAYALWEPGISSLSKMPLYDLVQMSMPLVVILATAAVSILEYRHRCKTADAAVRGVTGQQADYPAEQGTKNG